MYEFKKSHQFKYISYKQMNILDKFYISCLSLVVSLTRQENESKLLLLWHKTLELILRQLDYGGNHVAIIKMLSTLVTSLHLCGEDRASGGILGAIGLGKRSALSPQ